MQWVWALSVPQPQYEVRPFGRWHSVPADEGGLRILPMLAGRAHHRAPLDLHRAEIVGREGGTIELQNSAISVDSLEEREVFCRRIIWVWNAKKCKSASLINNIERRGDLHLSGKN